MKTSSLHRTIAASLYALFGWMQLAAEPVDSSVSGVHLSPPISVLSVIPVVATADAGLVRDELERGLPTGHREQGVFWITGHPIGCCHLQLGIHRSGGVDIAYVDNALNWSVPLSINNGRVDWMTRVLFAKIRHHEEFGGGFRVSGRTKIMLDSDWSVDTTTTLGYSYTERPWMSIHVGPLRTRISIGGPVGKLIDKKIQVVRSEIDNRIESAFGDSTKRALHAVWEQSHQTLRISTQPSVWMQTRPADIIFHGIAETPDDTFAVVAAIKLYADVFIGDRPPDQPRVPTPESVDNDMDSRLEFLLHLPITEAAEIARAQLVGKSIKGLPLSQITDVTIDTMPPDRLVVDVSLELGPVKASVSLIGAPRFDMETGALVIVIDVGGPVGLTSLPFIPETIRFDVSRSYDGLIDSLWGVLADVEIPGVETIAQLDEVAILGLYVSEDELVSHVRVAGHVGFLYDVMPRK